MSDEELIPYDMGPDCRPSGEPLRNLIPRTPHDHPVRKEARELRDQLREDLTRIYGPEVMHDALDTDEARSYFAAHEEMRAREAAFAERVHERGREVADELSALLPDGLRFEWTGDDE